MVNRSVRSTDHNLAKASTLRASQFTVAVDHLSWTTVAVQSMSGMPLLSSVLSSTMVVMVATLLEFAFRSTPLVKTTLEILPSPSANCNVLVCLSNPGPRCIWSRRIEPKICLITLQFPFRIICCWVTLINELTAPLLAPALTPDWLASESLEWNRVLELGRLQIKCQYLS